MDFDPLSNKVIGAAIEVHRVLGPGLLESVYEQAMAYEVAALGLQVQAQLPLPVSYKAIRLDCGFRFGSPGGESTDRGNQKRGIPGSDS